MTRVLALATDAYGGMGGIARYNMDWLAAMSDCRIDLLLMTTAEVLQDQVPAHVTVQHAAPQRLAMLAAAMRALRGQKPDWIWCGHLHLAPVAAVLAACWNIRFCVQVHGIDAWQQPSRWRRKAIERADMITAVSRYTRQQLLTWWRGAPERVRVLPNTVSDQFVPAVTRSMNCLSNVAADAYPVLLTVGRLSAAERYKGQDRVLRLLPALIERHPRLIYLIAGDGDDRQRLADLASALHVDAHVRFCGNVGNDALLALYRRADLMVMPSTGEGFGIAFLEAMACGTAAIGLRGDGSVDALQDGDLGDCTTETGLLDAMLHRLENPPDRTELSARVRSVFGREAFTAQARRLARQMSA